MTAYSRITYHSVAPQEQDLWPIRKALTVSDVDVDHPCLTLPRQPVEDHILMHQMHQAHDHLRNADLINVNAQDDDTGEFYDMKLRRCGTYYKLSGKWGKIIRKKGLDVGTEIRMRWDNGWLHFSVPNVRIVVPQEQNIAPLDQDLWPIKKALTLSDVDVNHPFLTLSGQLVEEHILVHWTIEARGRLRHEQCINLNVQDDDTGEFYDMKLKRCGTYYRLIGKWGQVIRKKGLDVGTEIRVRWDSGWLHFSVPDEPSMAPQEPSFAPREQRVAPQEWDQWPIKKALTLSDVDVNHPFLTLSGQLVREHILVHWTSEAREHLRHQQQANFNAYDDDTDDAYVMKLRWCGTYFKLIGKWGKIIRGKRLVVGREIKLRWHNECLHFSVPQ
ncbi:uncharacterized protein LOC131164661 [Malania oleifera]|uniref:uncharacterized protein LOC131164661 n=1 Tax=Malania oleifera TaxID=397392 RepID=UPI0025ADEB78|nr:uncharacterized protein LOC131164661 [Malania oleifera]XP_057977998.1 uncharacterized protein LOC131164661 [Malania oleifera]XP_057977999.1 uncharacterized protein LOC131164661 [Malania oleifera]XP_057978000.1 uncharacterized protein LOC131164661 [Malania oleifera]XP_057978001.1 uncharacterized protein LOC131164661 [Malania oleifera]